MNREAKQQAALSKKLVKKCNTLLSLNTVKKGKKENSPDSGKLDGLIYRTQVGENVDEIMSSVIQSDNGSETGKYEQKESNQSSSLNTF